MKETTAILVAVAGISVFAVVTYLIITKVHINPHSGAIIVNPINPLYQGYSPDELRELEKQGITPPNQGGNQGGYQFSLG